MRQQYKSIIISFNIIYLLLFLTVMYLDWCFSFWKWKLSVFSLHLVHIRLFAFQVMNFCSYFSINNSPYNISVAIFLSCNCRSHSLSLTAIVYLLLIWPEKRKRISGNDNVNEKIYCATELYNINNMLFIWFIWKRLPS